MLLKKIEKYIGRFAMLTFLTCLVLETTTGKGLLHYLLFDK